MARISLAQFQKIQKKQPAKAFRRSRRNPAPICHSARLDEDGFHLSFSGRLPGKERPRYDGRTGHFYTPGMTGSAHRHIAAMARNTFLKRPPFDGPVEIEMIIYRRMPKSFSAKKQEAALEGRLMPITKPDIDNQVKTLLDGLNRIVFEDDAQITDLVLRKRYAKEDGVEVRARPAALGSPGRAEAGHSDADDRKRSGSASCSRAGEPDQAGALIAIIMLQGKLPGKERPRRDGRTGHFYTPSMTGKAHRLIGIEGRAVHGSKPPVSGPIGMQMTFYRPPPGTFSKSKKRAALLGELAPTTKPDIDNQVKTLLDGLNGTIFTDDAQVTDLFLRKRYGDNHATEVLAWSMEGEAAGQRR